MYLWTRYRLVRMANRILVLSCRLEISMDLDDITDIEILRNLVKRNMVQMKKDSYATDGTDFIFKK